MPVELRPEAVERRGQTVELRVTIDPALDLLQDHFPGYPMLPGVVQLGWAVRAAQRECGVTGQLARVAALKFMRPLRPGPEATLRLEKLGPAEVAFSYLRGDQTYSCGRLCFTAAAA